MSRYVNIKEWKGPGQIKVHRDDEHLPSGRPKRWQVMVFIGRDAQGRARHRSKNLLGVFRDAKASVLVLHQQKAGGSLTPRSVMRLEDLAREWVQHKVGRSVSPRTLQQYSDAFDRYILPSLGHRRLTDLTLREIDHLYSAMLGGTHPCPTGSRGVSGRPLGNRTVRLANTVLSAALSQAVSWGYIPSNPAAGADLPDRSVKAKEVLNSAERVRFLEASRGAFYRVYYRTLLDTGLRPEEACALRWTDLDLARAVIGVNQAVTMGSNGEAVLAGPKTGSTRKVPMLDGLRAELLAHKDWQRERGLHESGFVFTNSNGRMLRPWTFPRRELKRVVKAAGITKQISPYSFRHTFATLHVAAGTPLKVVSDLLGHASIQQTADTYMHDDPDVTANWMGRYEACVSAADPRDRPPAN
jgi:integrase